MSTNSDPGTVPPLLSIGTLVVWLVCLAIGVLGLVLSYPGLRAPAEASAYLPTQVINVQLTPQPSLPPMAPMPAPPPDPTPDQGTRLPGSPTPLPAPRSIDKPVFTAVAPPSPAIAFALPIEGLTRIVDVGEAGYTRPIVPLPGSTVQGPGGGWSQSPQPLQAVATAPVAMRLALNEGEGRRPPPEYPREAVRGRQEGTVGLRFTVGEDGRVLSVEVVTPSRWPLLNQAAARAVAETWQFSPGFRRVYEVPIKFQLNP